MSTTQRNSAAIVGVDPSTADVLRQQTLVVLEVNHYFFEEILAFGPEAQFALAQRYRDAEPDEHVRAQIDATIAADREAASTLDRLIGRARRQL